jgi:hypothetical protein
MVVMFDYLVQVSVLLEMKIDYSLYVARHYYLYLGVMVEYMKMIGTLAMHVMIWLLVMANSILVMMVAMIFAMIIAVIFVIQNMATMTVILVFLNCARLYYQYFEKRRNYGLPLFVNYFGVMMVVMIDYLVPVVLFVS